MSLKRATSPDHVRSDLFLQCFFFGPLPVDGSTAGVSRNEFLRGKNCKLSPNWIKSFRTKLRSTAALLSSFDAKRLASDSLQAAFLRVVRPYLDLQ